MKTREELMVEGSNYLYSLNKFLAAKGVTVKDIQGYPTDEFDQPAFKVCWIELSDGTTLNVEGEHDLPYIDDDSPSREELEALLAQDKKG